MVTIFFLILGFTTIDDVIETVAIIISTCSLGHAAANFQQYEQYGFVPNYPGILMANPPTEKVRFWAHYCAGC